MAKRILMVCLGNICRSPAAEAILRDMAGQAGLALSVDSCGTAGWHQGHAPYGAMIKAAALRGYDLHRLRARQFRPSDFFDFDLILAADASVQRDIELQRPKGSLTPVHLLMDFVMGGDVPDPYYTRDFNQALDMIEAACAGLIKSLQPAQ